MVSTVQLGIWAMWVASHPSVPDFVCGFQPSFSSGTRSRLFRVLDISWSNSGRRALLSGIVSSRRILLPLFSHPDYARYNAGETGPPVSDFCARVVDLGGLKQALHDADLA